MNDRDLFKELSSALAEARKHSKGKLTTLKRTSSRQLQQSTRLHHSAPQSFNKSK